MNHIFFRKNNTTVNCKKNVRRYGKTQKNKEIFGIYEIKDRDMSDSPQSQGTPLNGRLTYYNVIQNQLMSQPGPHPDFFQDGGYKKNFKDAKFLILNFSYIFKSGANLSGRGVQTR